MPPKPATTYAPVKSVEIGCRQLCRNERVRLGDGPQRTAFVVRDPYIKNAQHEPSPLNTLSRRTCSCDTNLHINRCICQMSWKADRVERSPSCWHPYTPNKIHIGTYEGSLLYECIASTRLLIAEAARLLSSNPATGAIGLQAHSL